MFLGVWSRCRDDKTIIPLGVIDQEGAELQILLMLRRRICIGKIGFFIFKDGHQIETRNFAIMGETLYDFSGSVLKKVQLTDLDKNATVKANDDRGITVKLP